MKNIISFNIDLHKLRILLWLLPLLSIAMHWRIFSTDLVGTHLWRQSQTQINIQNFYRHDFNILNPRVNVMNRSETTLYRYEFPVMQWSIAAVQKVFGESIIVTRICLFLIGLMTIWGVFFFFKTLFKDEITGLLSAWLFNFSPLFFYYTMNPIPDNLALGASIWGLGWFLKYRESNRVYHLVWSALFMALAVAAKLPFIVFYATIGLYIFVMAAKAGLLAVGRYVRMTLIYTAFLIPVFIWYAWVIPSWGGNSVLKGVLNGGLSVDQAIHILTYHAKFTLVHQILTYSSLPLFGAGIYFVFKNKAYQKGIFWLMAISGLGVLTYFVFELNAIGTVHDYYMIPFMIPVFGLVAYGVRQLWVLGSLTRLICMLSLVTMPFMALLETKDSWSIEKSYCNPALIEYREDLRSVVPSTEVCIMLNDVSGHVMPYAVDKNGYIFDGDNLPTAWIEDMIRRFNVKYMYSDSRIIDQKPDVMSFLDTLLFERGTMRVYRLKTVEQLK